MTALAVLLGVAFVSGTLVFGDSVAGALRGASAANLKDVAVSVWAETLPAPDGEADRRPTTALSAELAARTGLSRGGTFTGAMGHGTRPGKQTLTVAGIYRDTRAVGDALGTLTEVLPHADGRKLDSILVRAAPRAASGLDQDIRRALGNSPLLRVQDRDRLTEAESGMIGEMLGMLYGLLGTTVVIGVLGVVNTPAMSVVERTREIGLLRAIGLDHRGVRRMVCPESVVISLFGAILGICTGVFLAWACGGLTGSALPTYETVLPWARIGLCLLLGLVVGVLASIWPARRATRLNMLRSIGAE
jgi:putative ABC transport system permease protein